MYSASQHQAQNAASETHLATSAEPPKCDISATAHALFPRFSATLIHDLKQPISAIQFNALAALRFIQSSESAVHPAVSESLADIKSDVARLSRLAQGLGAFLGVERGHDEVLDLNVEIESALSLL
jgi:signal transduction histidine kinase